MLYQDDDFYKTLKDVIVDDKRHETYAECVELAKKMAVHVYGDKPMYLLERARPREDNDVKVYRIENYEPTTKAGSDKAIDIVSKIFNPTLYSIRWQQQNQQVEELKQYTLDYYPNYNSIVSFNKDVLLKKMIADPNGLIAVRPKDVPTNDATKVEPIVLVYGSRNIWFQDKDHYLIHIKTEEPGENKLKTFYFEYYDKTSWIYFRSWYDASVKEIFIEDLQRYDHKFQEIPAWKLRGKSRDLDNGTIIYESFFSSALPHWNLAIIHESDLLGAYINHMHPEKYELAEECSYQFEWSGGLYPCRGGKIKYATSESEAKIMDCPKCSGTGLTSVKSPFGAYQFTKQKLDDVGGTNGLLPVGYINIPVEATKMLEERAEKMIAKGMWSINMDIEERVGENQSGVAKVIDRSAQHDTLSTIATVIFDIHTNNEFFFINKYIFGIEASSARKEEDKNLPQVNKPTMFDISSVAELVNNFKVAKDSGLDRNFLQTRQIEILSRDLSTNPDLKQFQIIMLNLDPLPGLSTDEIKSIVGREVTREDAIIHFNLKKFMHRAIQEDKNFLSKKMEEQYEKFLEYASEVVEATKVEIDENMFNEAQSASFPN